MLSIHIILLGHDWKRLLNRVPPDSPIRPLFAPARSIDYGRGVVTIDCNTNEAEGLLEFARKDCPQAVPAIENAISESGNSSSSD
jgi:hypothetical protein